MHRDPGYLLGVKPDRVETIFDFAAAKKFGAQAVGGAAASTAPVLAELADLIASDELNVPIAATYPSRRYARPTSNWRSGTPAGKVVLRMR